jgi:hypothetical protein
LLDFTVQEIGGKKIWKSPKPEFPPFLFLSEANKAKRQKGLLVALSGD